MRIQAKLTVLAVNLKRIAKLASALNILVPLYLRLTLDKIANICSNSKFLRLEMI